jgi:four helix bundle protein
MLYSLYTAISFKNHNLSLAKDQLINRRKKAMINRFEDLECWKSARDFNLGIFNLLDQNKFKNNWAIHNQLSRASLSIMNNVAEGFGRYGNNDKIKFFNISHASCNEVKSMLYLISGMKYISDTEFIHLKSQLEITQKQILGFIRYLNSK